VWGLDWGDGGLRRRVSWREIGEELRSGEAGTRIAKIGSDFGEGHEYESALGEAGMRNFKARLRKDEITVEENVEVEGAGAVGDGGGAITTELALDEKEGGKEGARSERGVKDDDGVQEAGLIEESDGGSGIERRTSGDVSDGRELREGRGERGVGMAGEAGKVGAESDVGAGHAVTRVASLRRSRASCVLASLQIGCDESRQKGTVTTDFHIKI
jgi:hypothetical protein